MPNQSTESFLASLLADVNDADPPQDYRSLQISILQDMDVKAPCLRGSFAPMEKCPLDAPPALVAHLDCDEECPAARSIEYDRLVSIEPRPEIEPEPVEEEPAPVLVRRAAA